jgi:molybdate transport system substrate-binding protein
MRLVRQSVKRRRVAAVAVLVAAVLAAGGLMSGLSGHQRELRVMTSGATTAAHLALAPLFERQSGAPVLTLATSTGLGATSIASRVRRGEAVDIVMLSRAALDELVADGSVIAASVIDLARSSVGMAVRVGAPKPDISTVAALRETLLRARSIAVSPQVSGVYLTTELFPKLGIATAMAAKTQRVDQGRAASPVARGEVELAFQQISELREVPGVEVVGPLPAEVQRVTVFSAGIAAKSPQPDAARAYLAYWRSPAGLRAIEASGLELIPPR